MTGDESNAKELLTELQRLKKDTKVRSIDVTLTLPSNPKGEQVVTPLGIGKLISTSASLADTITNPGESKPVTYNVTVRVKISNAIFALKKKLAA